MKKLKEELKYGKRGITLIALVITIIVLLILAGVTIVTLTGENGILTRAEESKKKTELEGLIEEVELAKSAMIADNKGDATQKASEFMNYMVENGVLKEDGLTFKDNENYSLYPNGNIMYNGEKVSNVRLTEHIEEREGKVFNAEDVVGQFRGKGYIYDGGISGDYIVALEAPEGYQFAYWMNENNDIVSYDESTNESYGGNSVSENVNTQSLHAVYTKEPVEVKPVVSISLSQRFPFDYDGQKYEVIAINAIYNGSNEYTEKETGLIRTYNSLYKDKLTLENVDGDMIRKNTSTLTGFFKMRLRYTLKMKETTKVNPIYARAYAIYTDSTGEDITIYSNVAYSAPLN